MCIAAACLLGCSRIDHPIVGKWKTTDDFSGSYSLDEIGWEIDFLPNGTFELLSDDGFRIQTRRTGGFGIEGEILGIEHPSSDHPTVYEVVFDESGNSLNLNGEEFSMNLVRASEPHKELHALPRIPESLEEATDLLISEMSEEDKLFVATRKEDDLIQFHTGWGMGIRNRFGLWSGNNKLLASCGSRWMHPDSASSVIIHSVWEQLRSEQDDSFLSKIEKIHALSDEVELEVSALLGQNFEELTRVINRSIHDLNPEKAEEGDVRFEIDMGEEAKGIQPDLDFLTEESISLSQFLNVVSFRYFARVDYEPNRIVLVARE
ncbi:hypothetical protein VDG1235_2775 [Verrucomicrobiia bacterium DG1235]|nr:hypothetical protein VDG1235_2775 [Verrucomicrobiae bacterium DG1235]